MAPLLLALSLIRPLDTLAPTQPGRPSFVSAASGIILKGDHYYLVADDEIHLGRFKLNSPQAGEFIPLFKGEKLPLDLKKRKKQKPDLESLCFVNGGTQILALPSGSKTNRVRGALLNLDTLQSRVVDFTELYEKLLETYPALNIEGAVVTRDSLKLFQRGNGSSAQNALISLSLAGVEEDLKRQRPIKKENILSYKPYSLGKLNNVRLGFSDATIGPDGDIYFLAVAEAEESTVKDGPFRGAVLGKIAADGNLTQIGVLDAREKPEGLVFLGSGRDFYIVTDADNIEVPAKLYQGQLPLLKRR